MRGKKKKNQKKDFLLTPNKLEKSIYTTIMCLQCYYFQEPKELGI